MAELNIAATQSTPGITTDTAAGAMVLRGDSYPENSFAFFGPVIQWLQDYLSEGTQPLRLDLRLLYLNTSSVKAMMDIFDMLEEAYSGGRSVAVNWYYETGNERIADLAEEFKEDCSFPFTIALSHDQP